MRRELLATTALALLLAAPGLRAFPADAAAQTPASGQAVPPPPPPPADPAEDPDELRRTEEVTVESASKVSSKLIDAPATMSVVTSETLASQPAQNMADTLRSVPGLNVIQTSARDINLTARQATSTLATSQLVTVDGRSVYLDFFGLVLWDLVPSPTSGEIKQIEVVRGPASVVWGANAVNGVVNIITKTPRENEGFGLVLGGGLFNRDDGSRESDGNGYQFNGSFSYAKAINETLVLPLERGLLQLRSLLASHGHGAARLPPARREPLPQRHGWRAPERLSDRWRDLSRRRRPAGRLRERRHQPAEVRPALRPGLHERRAHDVRGWLLRHRGDRPHGHRPVPARERLLRRLRARGLHEERAEDLGLRQLPGRRGAQPARLRPGHAGPDHPRVQDADLRPRGRQHERARRESHLHLRRQRSGRTTSTSRSRRATTAPSSAPTCTGSTSSTSSASRWAGASTSSATSRTRSSRRASASCSSPRRTTRSGPPTTAPSSRRRSSTTT